MKKGIEEGRKEGIEQGIEQGSRQTILEIAKSMLSKGINLDIISQCTKLSKEEIRTLK